MKLHEMHLINSLMEKHGLSGHISSEKLNGQRVHVITGPGQMIVLTKHAHHFHIFMNYEARPVNVELDLNLNLVSLDTGKWSLSDDDLLIRKAFEEKVKSWLPKGLGFGK